MKATAAALLLLATSGAAQAQDQPAGQPPAPPAVQAPAQPAAAPSQLTVQPPAQPGAAAQPPTIERVETPEGTVTIVRPTPRPQAPPPVLPPNPDAVPPVPSAGPAYSSGPYSSAYDYGYSSYYPYYPYYAYPYRYRRGAQTLAPRRNFDDIGPVPSFGHFDRRALQPGAQMQPRDGFGRILPPPRFPPNQFGPGAVPGSVPLPDTSIIIRRR